MIYFVPFVEKSGHHSPLAAMLATSTGRLKDAKGHARHAQLLRNRTLALHKCGNQIETIAAIFY